MLVAGALAGLVLVAPSLHAASSGTTWSPAPVSWSNGIVLCNFTTALPTVAVSALGLADSGMSVTLASVEEISPNGTPVAVSFLSNASWSQQNISGPDLFDLSYLAHASVEKPNETSTPIGSVDARVDYRLPAYAESPATNMSSVTMEVALSNWSWQGAGDRLALSFTVWPTYSATERLTGSSSNLSVTSSSVASGAPREYFIASTVANASTGPSGSSLVKVTPRAVVGGSRAFVTLWISAAAGSFSRLAYAASIGLPVPSTVAGIPVADFVAVAGTGAAVSLAVAVVTRRLRSRPSRLIYFDESEQ